MLQGEPDRVPNVELHVDWQVKQAFLGRPIAGVQDDVDFWYRAGYDYIYLRANYEYRMVGDGHAKQDRLYAGDMQLSHWEGEETSLISAWDDYEAYPWPDPATIDYSNLVCLCALPPPRHEDHLRRWRHFHACLAHHGLRDLLLCPG